MADYSRFPGGMAALAGHIHARNLSFGMYADSGTSTCGGYPGSRGFEARDAAAFAGWGADYLKYDNCYPKEGDSVRARYGAMRDALNATGRPILFSLCEWGVEEPWLWGRAVGNSWRTTGDSSASWLSLVNNLDNSVGLARYAGPGAWNDPDMLQVSENGRGERGGLPRVILLLACGPKGVKVVIVGGPRVDVPLRGSEVQLQVVDHSKTQPPVGHKMRRPFPLSKLGSRAALKALTLLARQLYAAAAGRNSPCINKRCRAPGKQCQPMLLTHPLNRWATQG